MSCRKAWCLIALVASGGGRPVARSRIAGQLWPDQDEDHARHALSTTLWRLGKAIADHDLVEDALLRSGPAGIAMAPDTCCDLRDFHALLAATDQDKRHVNLERAVALQSADLLPEEDNPWCNLERESLRGLLVDALDRLLAHYSAMDDHDNCVRVGQQLVAAEPYLEHAHRALIRAFGAMGERAKAARQFKACLHLLRSELGIDPMPETVAVYAQALGSLSLPASTLRLVPPRHDAAEGAYLRLRQHLLGAQRALDDLGHA